MSSPQVPEGPALTKQEVEAPAPGTHVVIVWSGGNGPHRYTLADAGHGRVWAHAPELDRPGYIDYERVLTDAFVGQERFHTRVWLAASTEEPKQ